MLDLIKKPLNLTPSHAACLDVDSVQCSHFLSKSRSSSYALLLDSTPRQISGPRFSDQKSSPYIPLPRVCPRPPLTTPTVPSSSTTNTYNDRSRYRSRPARPRACPQTIQHIRPCPPLPPQAPTTTPTILTRLPPPPTTTTNPQSGNCRSWARYSTNPPHSGALSAARQ